MSNAVEDLRKENESFVRELERYEMQYKKVFKDYLEVLQEHKTTFEKVSEIEKKLSNSNYITTNGMTTIQNFFQQPIMSPTSNGAKSGHGGSYLETFSSQLDATSHNPNSSIISDY
jgi:hypothetical protein